MSNGFYMRMLIGFVLVSALAVVPVFSQDFQGLATYRSKTTMDSDFGPPDMPEARKQEMRERMKKDLEKTYGLQFDRSASIYSEEEKLDAPGTGGNGPRIMFGMMGGMDGTYYKNIRSRTYTNQVETFGKLFLVHDSLPVWDWKLVGETKKIGNYTCYKATAIKKPDSVSFERMRELMRRRRNEAGTAKTDSIAKDTTDRRRSLLEALEAPKEQEVTAWYAPEIPINQGPGIYWGLPGLILEVNDGRTAILCNKIVLNPKEKLKIVEPDKGKQVDQKEYDGIVTEKMKEMSERFRNGNRRGQGPGPRGRF